jgi:hypothetical protein
MRLTRVNPFLGVVIGALCALPLSAAVVQAQDPMVGTWTLDVAKSKYDPGPLPKSATVVISPEGKGLKIAVDAEMPSGPMKWGYANARDGKDTPVTGNPNYEMVSVTQANPNESTITYKRGGKAVATSKVAVAKDGKMMTVTSEGTDAKGQKFHNVGHFTKK